MNHLTIDSISDTHTKHNRIILPGGDILIHSGDCSYRGQLSEVIPFLDWFADQDYSHLIFVPGNHDFIFEKNPTLMEEECKNRNIILLNDSGREIEGIRIHGSGISPWFHNWAFNRFRGAEIKKHWDLIPDDIEILITHGPPAGILDLTRPGSVYSEHVGCQDLLDKILKTKVKLHIFGHIHESRGYETRDNKLFLNASSLDDQYMFVSPGYFRVVKTGDNYSVQENQSLD